MGSNKIGALWESKYGGYTGVIEIDGKKIDVILFENKNKKSQKHPDLDICIRQPRENKAEARVSGIDKDDLPF